MAIDVFSFENESWQIGATTLSVNLGIRVLPDTFKARDHPVELTFKHKQ